jgi:succinate dehydrogenase hydrophobic anchor subunit
MRVVLLVLLVFALFYRVYPRSTGTYSKWAQRLANVSVTKEMG